MKANSDRRKAVPSPKKSKPVSTRKPKDDPHVAPLTTADLAINTFHYFSERIEFKSVFRPELWPRRRIVSWLFFFVLWHMLRKKNFTIGTSIRTHVGCIFTNCRALFCVVGQTLGHFVQSSSRIHKRHLERDLWLCRNWICSHYQTYRNRLILWQAWI